MSHPRRLFADAQDAVKRFPPLPGFGLAGLPYSKENAHSPRTPLNPQA